MILSRLLKITQKSLSREAIRYLKQRDLIKATVLKWGIGYLPSDKVLLALEEDATPLYDTGILIRKIDKSPLRQYVTFPMHNQYGDLIGFSGRPPLNNEEVKQRGLKKYWHSKFDKRRFLFGMNHAIASARDLGYMIVAEGQFDVIIASQYGVENIVATCGTALTENQIILLSRYVDKAYIVFDNDKAGKRAFEQLQKYQSEDIKLIPVFLPDTNGQKEDPDSYIRTYGKDKFLEVVLNDSENS